MKKIPTLFVRDPDNMKLVTEKVSPGLEWVLERWCVVREKLDGTACAVLGGRLYKRFTTQMDFPTGFIPSGPPSATVSKVPGWIPVGDGPEDQWHREAFGRYPSLSSGTFELIGPKVQGNPYGYMPKQLHELRRHEFVQDVAIGVVWTFKSIRNAVNDLLGEGLVFWGPEGPVAKIKRRDFGLPWPAKDE